MKSVVIAVVAGLAIVVAGIFVWRTLHPISDKFNPTDSLTVGQRLGQETAKAIQDQGRVVPVISADHQQNVGVASAVWRAFQAELKKHPGLELAPPEILTNTEDLPGCSGASFKNILARQASARVLVFLTPLQAWRQVTDPPAEPPSARIIVLSLPVYSAKTEFAGYFEHKLITLLFYRRTLGNPDDYQIFTAENYQTLPE